MELQVIGRRVKIRRDLKKFVGKSLVLRLRSLEHSVHGLHWALVDVAHEHQLLVVFLLVHVKVSYMVL